MRSRLTHHASRLRAASLLAGLLALNFRIDIARGQNIVVQSAAFLPANPAKLTDRDVGEFIFRAPAFGKSVEHPEARRVAAKLEQHVARFLAGAPFKPFHHTLGISGYEVYFDHPDEMFYALAIALPYLSEPAAKNVRAFLKAQLDASPPYAVEGFDPRAGHPRESYDVPEGLRAAGRGRAGSAFGIYAFWCWCYFGKDEASARTHWAGVQERARLLLELDYQFDVAAKGTGKGESAKLNGDLAGLLGLLRLARMNGEAAAEKQARGRVVQLMELRVNLERMNPDILEKSGRATKSLHNSRLARYGTLVPEVGEALRNLSEGRGAAYLKAFREERNGWYLAFGDRLIGGENYTNPLHFPQSLFAGAALIEQLPSEPLLAFIDVPWCPGDFSFIEKCVLALWASAGRPWTHYR